MRKQLLRSAARDDLRAIWHYIAADLVQNADKVLDDLKSAIEFLCAMPGTGHTRSDLRKSYRAWCVHRYIIVYRYDAESLTVMRIVHGHRNMRKIFR